MLIFIFSDVCVVYFYNLFHIYDKYFSSSLKVCFWVAGNWSGLSGADLLLVLVVFTDGSGCEFKSLSIWMSFFMEAAILDQCFGLSTNFHRRFLYRFRRIFVVVLVTVTYQIEYSINLTGFGTIVCNLSA